MRNMLPEVGDLQRSSDVAEPSLMSHKPAAETHKPTGATQTQGCLCVCLCVYVSLSSEEKWRANCGSPPLAGRRRHVWLRLAAAQLWLVQASRRYQMLHACCYIWDSLHVWWTVKKHQHSHSCSKAIVEPSTGVALCGFSLPALPEAATGWQHTQKEC